MKRNRPTPSFYALGRRVRHTATCPMGVTLSLIHEVQK